MPVRILAPMLAAALLLAGCSGGDKATGPDDLAYKPIAPDVFAVVIDPKIDVPKAEADFRKYCYDRPSCTVYGWTNPADVSPTAPLDDRHYQSLAVRYVAHAIGTDDMMWDCLRFLKARAPCLPKA